MSLVPVTSLNDEALGQALASLSLTLKLPEARRVAELLGRDPTETELTLFDTMWSEHCSYKSSRAVLKAHLPTEAGNVILGPGEDAGIIRFAEVDGKKYALVVGHESHNHPSQVMPVEGAATGIGGVVRDVYCMGADVIATLDPLRFGNPDGTHGERSLEIARQVMEGIAMYGNALGVPNLGGDVVFDDCYDDNCLVNVVAVGLVEEEHVVRSRVPQQARQEPYDIILVGKPTDWSGMGGAAFASADLDHAAATENKGSVQVPDPFLKRVLVLANQAALQLARDEGVEIGFKDLGAGGIACVTSELADSGGVGVELDLSLANLAEADLPPRVAACSETQERFALAVPSRLTPKFLTVYNETYELGAMYEGAGAGKIGEVLVPTEGESARYILRHGDQVLVDAPVNTITEGIAYDRPAQPRSAHAERELPLAGRDALEDLVALLASPHLCSRRALFQHYDSEVKAHTVLRPGEADAGVVAPVPNAAVGVALSVDGNPRIGRADAYLGGAYAVLESVRNVVCTGAVPMAVTDCLNYGSPEDPEVFQDFIDGVRGIGDACRGLGRLEAPDEPLPVVSGNVSFYNQSPGGGAVAPSPIVCCLGMVADVSRARSLSLKRAGDKVFAVGSLDRGLGGSLYAHWLDPQWIAPVDAPDYAAIQSEMRLVLEANQRGWAVAVHDVSDGGLLVALSEMALGPESPGEFGLQLTLEGEPPTLFAESGAFLVEVSQEHESDFLAAAGRHGATVTPVARVMEAPALRLSSGQEVALSFLSEAWERTMPQLLSRRKGVD